MKNENSPEVIAAKAVMSNAAATATELLAAVKTLGKTDMAVHHVDQILLGDNALTAVLIKRGSYTVSTYDNGETVIKYDDGKRFSTSRISRICRGSLIESLL